MPTYQSPKQCCINFSKKFEDITGQKYSKSDKDIYNKLNEFGDEDKAISIAQKKNKDHLSNGYLYPSQMVPGTKIHELVSSIKSNINKQLH